VHPPHLHLLAWYPPQRPSPQCQVPSRPLWPLHLQPLVGHLPSTSALAPHLAGRLLVVPARQLPLSMRMPQLHHSAFHWGVRKQGAVQACLVPHQPRPQLHLQQQLLLGHLLCSSSRRALVQAKQAWGQHLQQLLNLLQVRYPLSHWHRRQLQQLVYPW
jgi:hypothetical protein